MYGYVKVGAAIPELKVAHCQYNAEKIIACIKQAAASHIKLLVFPELSITGYTCGDLFLQPFLLTESEAALKSILNKTKDLDIIIVVGLPVFADNQRFNTAAVASRGKLLGLIPKTYIPNFGEFYEKRWFSSAEALSAGQIEFCGQTVPLGNHLLFRNEENKNFTFGVEICEDLWAPIPPSSRLAMGGATVICNLSASNALAAKDEFRQDLIAQQSARCMAGYIYASAGTGESTTDLVFSGHGLIYQKGNLCAESERFSLDTQIIMSEIDLDYLMFSRMNYNVFTDGRSSFPVNEIGFTLADQQPPDVKLPQKPFVPEKSPQSDKYYSDIFSIQMFGLIKRLEHIGTQTSVIGISGGLDSTLALLAVVAAYAIMKVSRKKIIGITMPGFGTTGRTYNNARKLMEILGIDSREISIKEACLQHFKDIDKSPQIHDITFENAQARERMQILMDIANRENGIVIGTGDLSELALGWTTYNGDHMSMYALNSGVPKTLVRGMIEWIVENKVFDEITSAILTDILETPVSPELLPADKQGEISQKTEELVGPYELQDFFIYYTLKHGFPPKKLAYMASLSFQGLYSGKEILHWLTLFYKRFFSQQYKRSCAPDGPKVQAVSLSPRGDLRMPSDACADLWLKELESLQDKEPYK